MKPLFILVTVLTLFNACKEDKYIPQAFQVNLDEEFLIHGNDLVRLTQNEDFSFSFTSVLEDSRCPASVLCVWEGQFKGAFSCNNCTTNPFELILRAGHENINIYEDTNYKVELLEVLPIRSSVANIPFEDYQLKMVIREL